MLYIISTPIGNLGDITIRALETLKKVDLIAAEDTRHTGKLLKHFSVKTPQVSYHEYNKTTRAPDLIHKMKQGLSIGLVSDAGTPGISDPGFHLIRETQKANLEVTTTPGATALIPALILSGCPVDQFQFLGFLPIKPTKKIKKLETLKSYGKTVILYESPYKIVKTLKSIQTVFGDISVTLCREITKMNEEIKTLAISEWLTFYETHSTKGEFVVIFIAEPHSETI
ncbi:16S rRNA (cytidine(1402)-2'-O)-methyltransferase [PVC group bacterium (ex Bugula neritina AB1)]|nr:16S rRNA (cytidine(1402)-2'-O)-methyltransferase [PVC group bacterium (ex Bugula neritina AB1)]